MVELLLFLRFFVTSSVRCRSDKGKTIREFKMARKGGTARNKMQLLNVQCNTDLDRDESAS